MGSLGEEFHDAAIQDNLQCQRRSLSARLHNRSQLPHWRTRKNHDTHMHTTPKTRMTLTHEKSPSLPQVPSLASDQRSIPDPFHPAAPAVVPKTQFLSGLCQRHHSARGIEISLRVPMRQSSYWNLPAQERKSKREKHRPKTLSITLNARALFSDEGIHRPIRILDLSIHCMSARRKS